MAAVVRGALTAHEQWIVGGGPLPTGVRAVTRPAVRAGHRVGLYTLPLAPGRVVIELSQALPVGERSGRRGLPHQRTGQQQHGGETRPTAPRGQGERGGRRHQTGREQQVRPVRGQVAEGRPRRDQHQYRATAGQGPGPRPSVRDRDPGSDHHQTGEHERLPVRTAVGRRERVPEQVGRPPLQRQPDSRHQPRPRPPFAPGHTPLEDECAGREQCDGAQEEGGGEEAVRAGEQPGKHIGPVSGLERPVPAGVGVFRAQVDGNQDGRREPDPQQHAPGRPRQPP